MSENNVDINLEQILATVLHTTGAVEFDSHALIADYSQFAVAINGASEGKLKIELVNLEGVDLDAIAE